MSDIELVKAEDLAGRGEYERSETKGRRYLNDEHKELIKEGKKAIKIVENLKKQLIEENISNEERAKKLEEIDKANKLAEERNRKLELIHEGHSVDGANEIIKLERKEGRIMAERRVVCGKARSCKLVGGKVSEVYDEVGRYWWTYNDFILRYGTDEEIKKLEKNEENKVEKVDGVGSVEIPKIMVMTTADGAGGVPSGAGVVAPNIGVVEEKIADFKVPGKVIVDSSKVDSDRVKIVNEKRTEEKEPDPYNWYIKQLLRRDI